MTAKEFQEKTVLKRLEILKKSGAYIGARELPSYFVYLYALEGFFVEVYRLKELNQVQFIEVQTNRDLLTEYVNIDFF